MHLHRLVMIRFVGRLRQLAILVGRVIFIARQVRSLVLVLLASQDEQYAAEY